MQDQQQIQDWEVLKEDISHLIEAVENNSTNSIPMSMPGNDNTLVVRPS